ncbi:MAG TPA: SUMF1/EgtB/PvdO family nonheme iron enzyme [Ktedonosporobacter sp.]|nr:SUMF1/EgtB/PvdO family nonheme iron enzyme [Ktedonosporobacter sp.]
MRINELLSQLHGGRWLNSDIREWLVAKTRDACITVPGGIYRLGNPEELQFDLQLKTYLLSRVLVTNFEFTQFLQESRIPNHVDGTYLWLNDINVNLPIQYLGNGKYAIKKGYENHPVTGVTWFGSALYCLALGGRLPTEAEWEVAAKAGDSNSLYPWGAEDPTPRRGNYAEYIGTTTPIDAYSPNAWGVHDMAGNVRQWCADWYSAAIPYPLARDLEIDEPVRVMKVVRGGAWNKGPQHLPCYVRRGKWPRMGSDSCGFRVAFAPAAIADQITMTRGKEKTYDE